MPEGDRTRMGGTMRLGSRVTVLRPGSQAFQLYGGEGMEELEVLYLDAWISWDVLMLERQLSWLFRPPELVISQIRDTLLYIWYLVIRFGSVHGEVRPIDPATVFCQPSSGMHVHRIFAPTVQVHERHRHRYEVNPSVVESLEQSGMKLVGRNQDGTGERMEVLELERDTHPYFMGAQVGHFVQIVSECSSSRPSACDVHVIWS